MRDEITGTPPRPNATAALDTYLSSDNEVLRCAATRALATRAGSASGRAPGSKSRLRDLLLDPDPDVRSDAMTGFADLAVPADADTLRRSLEGDPVREVKLAALGALARIADAGSVDLLCALVRDRAGDRVAWEDESGDWDDWLDIQIAAIGALGRMGVTDAIEDMLAARDDEFGQTLDMPVFNALANMGEDGAIWLLAIAQTETGLARKRAVDILARMAPKTLRDHVPELLSSDDPALRGIAVRLLPADSAEAAEIARHDTAAEVRLAAFDHCLTAQPDVAHTALADDAPGIQAAGLAALQLPRDVAFHDALVDNLLAWLDRGAPVLMAAAATHLPRLAPNRAEQALLALVADADRPLEARLAAVRALAEAQPRVGTETLAGLLANPAQQVRTTTLTLLRERADAGDEAAVEAIAAAVTGTLLSEADATASHADEADAPDLAAPKGEGAGPSAIRITRDGEIVRATGEAGDSSGSTLAAILDPHAPDVPGLAEETPEEAAPKRRKRRPVEGPDEVADALMREALVTCGAVSSARIEAAVLVQTRADAPDLRRAAWQAFSVRCASSDICAQACHAAGMALGDADPVVRLAAFDVLCVKGPTEAHLARALEDADALVRAAALGHAPVATALAHLGDEAQPIRRAALSRVTESGGKVDMEAALETLLCAERADTLAELLRDNPHGQALLLERLSQDGFTRRQALVSLDALGRMDGGAGGVAAQAVAA